MCFLAIEEVVSLASTYRRMVFSSIFSPEGKGLFSNEKCVMKFPLLIQFMHLKASSYKEGTKTLESTLGQFCRNRTFSSEDKEQRKVHP